MKKNKKAKFCFNLGYERKSFAQKGGNKISLGRYYSFHFVEEHKKKKAEKNIPILCAKQFKSSKLDEKLDYFKFYIKTKFIENYKVRIGVQVSIFVILE